MRTLLLMSMICLVACGEEDGPTMRPGENCKGCHGELTLAGTVFPSAQAEANEGIAGVTVSVLDSAQNTLTLTSNSAGNFYTDKPITWPANMTLTLGTRRATMSGAPSGDCATCHTIGVQGLIYLP